MTEYYHKELEITSTDIENETCVETIRYWMMVIDEDLAELKLQIKQANIKRSVNGAYSNSDWYFGVQKKRDIYGLLRQKMQNRLAMIKPKHKEKFESILIGNCQDIMSDHEYEDAVARTLAEMRDEVETETDYVDRL